MNVFAVRAAELAANRPALTAAVEPLLKAREAVEQQIADLDRKVLRLARNNAQVRRFMTSPGVGPIIPKSDGSIREAIPKPRVDYVFDLWAERVATWRQSGMLASTCDDDVSVAMATGHDNRLVHAVRRPEGPILLVRQSSSRRTLASFSTFRLLTPHDLHPENDFGRQAAGVRAQRYGLLPQRIDLGVERGYARLLERCRLLHRAMIYSLKLLPPRLTRARNVTKPSRSVRNSARYSTVAFARSFSKARSMTR
jgi:hypothetical protein